MVIFNSSFVDYLSRRRWCRHRAHFSPHSIFCCHYNSPYLREDMQLPLPLGLSILLIGTIRFWKLVFTGIVAGIGLLYKSVMACCRVEKCISDEYDVSETSCWKCIRDGLKSTMANFMSPFPSLLSAEHEAANATATILDASSTLTAYTATLDTSCLEIAGACFAQCKGYNTLPLKWGAVLLANPPHHRIPSQRPPNVQDQMYALVDQGVRRALAYSPEKHLRHEMARCAKIMRDSVSGLDL